MILTATLRVAAAAILIARYVFAAPGAPAAARWDGTVHIPSHDTRLIIDLAQSRSGGWIGSVILPGFDVQGAPVNNLSVTDSAVSFDLPDVLGGIKVRGKITAEGAFTGSFEQAGNTAPFTLRRAGAPQVTLPRRSTAVSKDMEGVWEGDMMAIDHNVHVQLTLRNDANGKATATFVCRGHQEVKIPVALVTEYSGVLTLEAPDAYLTYDGRIRDGAINGTWQDGSMEVPLILHRTAQP